MHRQLMVDSHNWSWRRIAGELPLLATTVENGKWLNTALLLSNVWLTVRRKRRCDRGNPTCKLCEDVGVDCTYDDLEFLR